MKETKLFCFICNKQTNYERWCDFTRRHLKQEHNIQMDEQEYYDKYLKREGEGICCKTNKSTYFCGLHYGYSKYYLTKIEKANWKRIELFNGEILEKEGVKIFCEVCKKELEFKTKERFLVDHLRKVHGIQTNKEYYDKYFKKDGDGICVTCKGETNFVDLDKGYTNYCSNACVSKNDGIKKKKEYTAMEHFGVNHIFQSDHFREKYKETCLEKYGEDNYFKTEEFKEKNKNTRLDKYNDENYNNKESRKITNLGKYGVSAPLQNKDILEKMKQTNLERYGSEFLASLNTTIREKINITNRKKHRENIDNIIKRNDLNLEFIEKISKCSFYKFLCKECNKEFVIHYNLYRIRVIHKHRICTHCNNPESYRVSNPEIEIFKLLKNNYGGEILQSNRKIIVPYELDIYLPDLKLAFEFNGLFWHNELNKDFDYHLMKTEKCEYQGIHLIHIYEDDWKYKQDIVKSRILNLLGKSNKIYARNCILKELDFKETKQFLIDNHIQGYCASKINVGLYLNNELVSLMTFGKLRINLGNKEVKEGEFELLRFCNKLNNTVIGGANRLFKYFIKMYNPIKVISYADRSWTMNNGNTLYNKLGFELDKTTQQNYYYIVDGRRENRFKYRKDVLIREGYDSNKTEHEIMIDRDIFRIYDSGQLKFVYE